MTSATSTPTDHTRDPTALIDQLASFLKASTIYPAEHRRVVEAGTDLLAQIGQWVDPMTWLLVRVRGDDLVVMDHFVESPGPLTTWMQKCFRDSAVAGIEIGPEADLPTLIEFSETLRRSCGKNADDFSEMWPDDHPKIRPLQLVFAGGHDPRTGRPIGIDGAAGATGTAGASAQDLWKIDVVRHLVEDEWLASKLSTVEKALTKDVPQKEQEGGIDLLTEIVKLLPADVLREPTRLNGVVEQILDIMQGSIVALTQAPEGFEEELTRTVLSVARKYFENRSESTKEIEPGLPTGRPEDAKIADDLPSLLAEIEELPSARNFRLPPRRELLSDEVLDRELLGIYLYLLTNSQLKETLKKLEFCIQSVLAKLTEEKLKTIDAYFKELRELGPDTPPDHPTGRIINLLHQIGHGKLIHSRRYLTAEQVVNTFPTFFVPYAAALSDQPTDLHKLKTIITAIPEQRMVLGAELLGADGSLDNPALVDKIIALAGRETLPLVTRIAIISQEWAKVRVAQYLRHMDLPNRESAALRCVDPPSLLPSNYLQNLCKIAQSGEQSGPLREFSGTLLRNFITDSASFPEQRERRINAIRVLRSMPSTETEELLVLLSKAGKFTRFGSTARAVRKAAAESLNEIRNLEDHK